MLYLIVSLLMVLGVALFVAAPLVGGTEQQQLQSADPKRARLDQEHAQALQGLRELEFDREMGKLSDEDCQDLRRQLENKALAAMAAMEKIKGETKPAPASVALRRPVPRSAARRVVTQVNVCPECGVRLKSSANFCTECGASLDVKERASS
ncbi:MAG: c-type cytochrome biogenesis protein CcmI [Candidatus Binataceae bacterium]|jgi:cytochrome c-type biogenesis protein CcmI